MKKINCIEIFIIIIIILNSGYTLSLTNNKLTFISLALLTFSLIFVLLIKKVDFIHTGSAKFAIFLYFGITLAFFVNFDLDSINDYIRYFMFITCGYCIAKLITLKQFVFYFSRTMRYITVISLIMFIFIKHFNLVSYLPVITTNSVNMYYNCYIYFMQIATNTRNSAIFWEPGLYAAFLAFALVLEISFVSKNERNNFYIILYIIAMFTTQSTSGYIYLIFIFLLSLTIKAKNVKQSLIFLLVTSFAIYIYWNYNDIINKLVVLNPTIFSKIQVKNMSFTDRTLNPIVDMMILFQNPFGCGLSKLTPLVQTTSNNMGSYVYTRTSTLTFFFATFGFLGGIAYNGIWLYGIIKSGRLNTIGKFILILLFIFVTMSSPLNSNLTVWILIFIMCESSNDKNNNIISISPAVDVKR